MGTVFMFAGQGSQYYQMGRELYEHHRVFRDWLDYGSRLLEPHLKLSLIDLLYQDGTGRFERFDRTRYTHPAIFCLNYSMARTLLAEGIQPTHYLGYSLGELVAWTLAGAVRLEDALPVVSEIAARIEDRTAPGGMLAVLAPVPPRPFAGVEIASINYAENFVVSGPRPRIEELHGELKARDIVAQVLPIRHGFHSFLLDPIEAEIKRLFSGLGGGPIEKPVVSSQQARELVAGDWNSEYCWEVLRKPVRFYDTIRSMERTGPWRYIDAGPSGTLAAFTRQIAGRDGPSTSHAILTPFGKDLRGLEKLKALC